MEAVLSARAGSKSAHRIGQRTRFRKRPYRTLRVPQRKRAVTHLRQQPACMSLVAGYPGHGSFTASRGCIVIHF
jgi:hypothetical protein